MGVRPSPRGLFADPLNLIAVAVAAVWGAVAVFFRPAGDFGVETDFYGDFAVYSKQWIHGEPTVMNGFRGPFYYILLGAAAELFRDGFLAAKALSFVCAAAGVRVLGEAIRRLWDTPTAVIACLFVAANATFLEYSYRAGSDPVFWLLFVGAVALLFPAPETSRNPARPGRKNPVPPYPRRRLWFAAGAVAGLAYLTRYNGAALVPGAVAAAWILFGTRRGILPALSFLGAFALVIAPWSLFLWAETGDPFWNQNFQNVAVAALAGGAGLAAQGNFMGAVGFESVWEVIRVHPPHVVGSILANLGRHIAADAAQLVGWPLTAVAAAGAVLHGRGWFTRRRLAFLAVGLCTYGVLLTVFYNPRFMLPLLPWWSAAAGGLAGLARLTRNRVRPVWVGAAMAVVAGAATVQAVRLSQHPMRHGGLAVEYAALARNARLTGMPFGPGTPIAARKPHIGYYLGAPVIPIPPGEFEDLRASGAHYLLVSGIEVSAIPGFLPLWNPRKASDVPPPLALVASGNVPVEGGHRVATLYAVRDPLPHVPAKRRSAPLPDPPPEGFSRIDALRLRLARWLLAWNGPGPLDAVIERLEERHPGHPEVLLVRGDADLEAGAPEEARTAYERALAAAPGDERILFRLASVAVLADDQGRFERLLATWSAGPGRDDGRDWAGVGARYLNRRVHAAALAPLVRAMADDSTPRNTKRVIYTFFELGYVENARQLVEAYLSRMPEDSEAVSLREKILEKAARQ